MGQAYKEVQGGAKHGTNHISFRGRVIKEYAHKKLLMILVSNEGERKRGIIKKDVCLAFEEIEKKLRIGDLIEIEGILQEGKDGREEILADDVKLLQQTNMNSVETGLLEDSQFAGAKSRQYYHTLMLTDPLCIFSLKAKSCILAALNQELLQKGYCSVSTPVLQHNFFAGGARPFVTHMLDSDTDMYLRITSEIALKLLVAGGLNKVYEIGNYFRNGSVNEVHTVPFQAVEIYQTYTQENEIRKLANDILMKMEQSMEPLLQQYSIAPNIEFKNEIPSVDFEGYVQMLGYKGFRLEDYRTYPEESELGGVKGDLAADAKALYKWFKQKLIKNQIQPVWITDLPAGQSPLIEKKSNYSLKRSYLIVNGATLAETAQSEIDPGVLEGNLCKQSQDSQKDYPHDYSAFLHACKLGMPPVTSLFISLDRFIPAIAGIENINTYKMNI